MLRLFVFLLFLGSLSSCWDLKTGDPIDAFAPGLWQGRFYLDQQMVPVLYDVQNTDNERPIVFVFRTADEQLVSDTVYYYGDTVFAYFDAHQTYLKAIYQIDQMEGFLYDQSARNYPIRFTGLKGPKHRFPNIREQPIADLTGEWTLNAGITQDSSITGSLRLTAQNNTATGTLLLQGKTYKMEGTVQGNKLYLSGFDGRTITWLGTLIQDANTLDKGTLRVNEDFYYLTAKSKAGIENVE